MFFHSTISSLPFPYLWVVFFFYFPGTGCQQMFRETVSLCLNAPAGRLLLLPADLLPSQSLLQEQEPHSLSGKHGFLGAFTFFPSFYVFGS